MNISRSLFLIIWIFSLGIVIIIGLSSRYVHRYFDTSQFVKNCFVQNKFKKESETRQKYLLQTIEQQLSCAQTNNMNWMREFQKDTAAYPQNIFAYCRKFIMKMRNSSSTMKMADTTINLEMLLNDKEPFKVLFQFVAEDDSLVLTGVQNLCPLFKKINCYQGHINQEVP